MTSHPVPNLADFEIQVHPMKGRCLHARKAIRGGSVVFQMTGTILPIDQATAHALQYGDGLALESSTKIDDNLNHSCDPNCRMQFLPTGEVLLVALHDIEPGDELTFDYFTTEWDMVEQNCWFTCACGSPHCHGDIKGFKYLPADERDAIKPFVSPFILSKY